MVEEFIKTIKSNFDSSKSKYEFVEIILGKYTNLEFNKNINSIFFEKMIEKFKEKIEDNNINYRKYVLYEYDNKQLITFNNGSSIAHRIELKKNNFIKSDKIDFMYKITQKFKIENDSFEPRFNYDTIDTIDGIQFTYKTINIEFILLNNNEKIIRIICNQKNIDNLKKIFKLFDI